MIFDMDIWTRMTSNTAANGVRTRFTEKGVQETVYKDGLPISTRDVSDDYVVTDHEDGRKVWTAKAKPVGRYRGFGMAAQPVQAPKYPASIRHFTVEEEDQ